MRLRTRSKRRFSATRRPDEGGDPFLVQRQADVFERPAVAVEEIQTTDRNLLSQVASDGGVMNDRRGGNDRSYRSNIHICFLEASARAMILSASTLSVMRRAPAHASFCQSA